MVGSRQVGHCALGVIETVGGRHLIDGAGIALVVGDGLVDADVLGLDDLVGIGADGDTVVALIQHVGLGRVGVVGGHVLVLEADGDGFALSRLEDLGLLEGDEVGAGLFDATIGVGGIEVGLDGVASGLGAVVGNGHIEGDLAVSVLDVAHLLAELGVREAVTEGILHHLVVVDQPFLGGCLPEAVSHVDAFVVVDEGGGNGFGLAGEADEGRLVVVHVGVGEGTEVVVGGCLGQITDEGVGGLAGGVGCALQHLTQGGEAGLSRGRAPEDGLDLRILADEVQIEGVGAVVDQDHLVEGAGDLGDHVAFGLGQLQEALSILEIGVGLVVVVIGEVLGLHVDGKICTLAADATDDHDGGIGEVLGVLHELVAVLGGGRLGKGPVLFEHLDLGAVLTVVRVELAQFGVGFQTGFLDAVQEAGGGVVRGHGARAGATIDGVGRGPAEDVDLAVLEGQGLIRVLEHGDGLALDVLGKVARGGDGGRLEFVLVGRLGDQVRQGAQEHRGQGHDDGHEGDQPGL